MDRLDAKSTLLDKALDGVLCSQLVKGSEKIEVLTEVMGILKELEWLELELDYAGLSVFFADMLRKDEVANVQRVRDMMGNVKKMMRRELSRMYFEKNEIIAEL